MAIPKLFWWNAEVASIISEPLLLSQHVQCMQSHLTAFSIKQWLLQWLFTGLAVLRISQSHLETEESLGPIPLATQLQESKCCLDGSFSSGSSCSNLLAIEIGDQKEAGEEHSKGSFHNSLEGWQKHLSQQGKT